LLRERQERTMLILARNGLTVEYLKINHISELGTYEGTSDTRIGRHTVSNSSKVRQNLTIYALSSFSRVRCTDLMSVMHPIGFSGPENGGWKSGVMEQCQWESAGAVVCYCCASTSVVALPG
jgi:hypothetical protein